MSHELAASSSLVAIKLSNIKVGREAPGEYEDQVSCISNEKKQLILMGNLAGHEKSAIDSYYWKHYIENNICLTCPYF